jgi:TRAP-type transport system periplasmic protein
MPTDPFARLSELRVTRRQILGGLALGAGSLSLGPLIEACGQGSSTTSTSSPSGRYVMKIAFSSDTTTPQGAGLVQFKTLAEAATGGRLRVLLFINGQLGSEADVLKGLQLSTIEGYSGSTASFSATVAPLGILDLPYLFRSYDHLYHVLDGSQGKRLMALSESNGVHILGYMTGGVRDTYNNGRPINEPSDMKGMKLRTAQSAVYVAVFKAFGAAPTPLAFGDVYLALKTGTLDGAETSLVPMLAAHQDEVVKYISLTHHGMSANMFAVGATWFKSLPNDIQSAIQTAATTATTTVRNGILDGDDSTLAILKAHGKTIVQPDGAAFRTIAQGVWPSFSSAFGQANIDAIVNTQ